jgi:DNA topoisomerase-3
MNLGKSLFIAEKPSVAQEFARVLGVSGSAGKGYLESEQYVVTWCVGHLVTMSYPDAYDPALKKWSMNTLPFIPDNYKYEVIEDVRKQYDIVAGLLNREDVERIYVCTDSGREGEYIYRLVDQMAGVSNTKDKRRVWIDSQTEEEIKRGIREAKPLSAYDNLASAAYMRAIEDYLMGINFSRVMTIRFGRSMADYLGRKYVVISMGRVMTCVLGMVVRREREIRDFVKTPFYRVMADLENGISAEWRETEGSVAWHKPVLYKNNGFKAKEDAQKLIDYLKREEPSEALIESIERKTEKKNPPLLYNLAELQNDCSRFFKMSPDQTLATAQELYEKKLTTYPRTDARVLSTAVAKEIGRNLSGISSLPEFKDICREISESGSYRKIASTRYTNDKQITDHYAIIPTGQGFSALRSLSARSAAVYKMIVRRFLSIFMPQAVYSRVNMVLKIRTEHFYAGIRVLKDPGYLRVLEAGRPPQEAGGQDNGTDSAQTYEILSKLRKGMKLPVKGFSIKEGETSPPKRYNSGSMILAMENAGQLIEDEELREQIKGCGIGTSATRADILKKLVKIRYLNLNSKTQVITPTLLGEMVFDASACSIPSLLNPDLTASWEKGLNYLAEGTITSDEYMDKLRGFITRRTNYVKGMGSVYAMRSYYDKAAVYYKKESSRRGKSAKSSKTEGTGKTAKTGRKKTAKKEKKQKENES